MAVHRRVTLFVDLQKAFGKAKLEEASWRKLGEEGASVKYINRIKEMYKGQWNWKVTVC
jgi:hypothetical protein